MALGLAMIGLIMSAAVVSVGQICLEQGNLQDALNNAVQAMETANNQTSSTLVDLVEANSDFQNVGETSFSDTSGQIQARVEAPFTPWFWATWMGATPFQVVAIR